MSRPVVTVGKHKVTLVRPASFSACYDLLVAANTSRPRALAAALGMCWQGLGRPKARFETTLNVLAYGGQVMDELVGRGVSVEELFAAGAVAYNLAAAATVTEPEIAEVEGNSAAPEDDSTSR